MTSRHAQVEAALQKAIAHDGLRVVYQPQVDSRTRGVFAWETLCRWDDPVLGTVRPDEFIAVAEATGLILPLGRWVWTCVARDLKALLTAYPGTRVAVNVSMRELGSPTFFEHLGPWLDSLPAEHVHQLEIEITESQWGELSGELSTRLRALQARGLSLAIDDFGVGHSNLERLHALPFDKIKLDKSFVRQLDADAGQQMVRETVALASETGRLLVAEGVETERECLRLQALGCPLVQGYWFHAPAPLAHWLQPAAG